MPVFASRLQVLTIELSRQLMFDSETTPEESLENQRAEMETTIKATYPAHAPRLLAELEEVTLQCRLMLL